MKRIITIIFAALLLCSCSDRLNILFDTPFVSIMDDGNGSEMIIPKEMDNVLSTLTVKVNASSNYFKEPIVIEYEVIKGAGLTEDVDYKIQPNTKSPLTFTPGMYSLPVRIIWYKNASLDPDKDNTLTIKLKSSSLKEMVIGYPGPDAKYSTYKFTKK